MNIEELKHALGVEISQIQLDINSLYGSNSESLERRAMLTRLQVLITVRKALMEVKTAMTLIQLYSLNTNWSLDTVITVYDPNSTNTPSDMTVRKALNRYATCEIAFFRDDRIYLYYVYHKEVK